MLLLIPFQTMSEPQLVTAEAATQQQVLIGYTRARNVLILSAEESGRVEQVFADIGDSVPGEGRFTCLDATLLKLEQQGNQAEQARVQVDIDHFRKQVNRYSNLMERKGSAQIQLDESQRNLDSTIQQLKVLKIQHLVLVERLSRLCVSAPTGWLVIERLVEPGQWVTKGQQVARVGNFSRLLIPFALSSAEFQALQETKELKIRLPDLGVDLASHVERVSPAFDEASRKIPVELEISDGLENHRGGLRAELRLYLPLSSGAVDLPAAALSERYEQYWLKREDGSEVKVVYLGQDGANRVRVVSPDVAPGQRFQLTGS